MVVLEYAPLYKEQYIDTEHRHGQFWLFSDHYKFSRFLVPFKIMQLRYESSNKFELAVVVYTRAKIDTLMLKGIPRPKSYIRQGPWCDQN